ncbi:MAG: FlgD immunoglobulin-like domain containing protein, partial [Bacteroidota bacterium]
IFTHDGPGSPDSVKVNGNGIVNVADDTDGIPKTYALKQNYPNPFNPITVLKYQLPVTSNVMFKIYNILGQEVKTLTDEIQDAGYKSIEWNSTNNSGNIVASGVYFYRIEATSVSDPSKSFTQIRKMLLIR